MVLTCWQRMDGLLHLPRRCAGLAGSAAVCGRSLTRPRPASGPAAPRAPGARGAVFGASAPALRDNARYRDWAARMERHTCSAGAVGALCRWAATIDVRPLLAGLRVPALVIHRRGDHSVPVAEGRYLAGHIPDADYAELPGEDHALFVGISGPPSAP